MPLDFTKIRYELDTTYADLRPTDLVIDKSGQAWPIAELGPEEPVVGVNFWLCDPVTGVKMHYVTKLRIEPVKVSRLPTQADEAAKVEAEFPPCEHEWTDSDPAHFTKGLVRCRQCGDIQPRGKLEAEFVKGEVIVKKEDTLDATMASAVAAVEEIGGTVEADFPKASAPIGAGGNVETSGSDVEAPKWGMFDDPIASAVALVEGELGGTVEAEVTAEEVGAAAAATDDAPVSLPPFADMTPLEQRSHLYLLHGLYGSDVTGKAELIAIHEQVHTQHDAGTLNSRHVPHVHEEA